MVKSDLPLVPETVLKKRHQIDDMRRRKAAEIEESKSSKNLKSKRFYVIKPEKFLVQARNRRNHAKRYLRVTKKGMQKRASNKPVFQEKIVPENEDEATEDISNTKTVIKYQANSVGANVVFCIRIRSNDGAPRQVLTVLKDLGLLHVHDAVFLKYDEIMRRKLHLVEPFVLYGKPNKGVIADLIERRGYGRLLAGIAAAGKPERIPLSDNLVIEDALGEKHGIICKEDLVHEIAEAGDNFDAVTQFLWPFRLADSKSKFERQTLKQKDGKFYGDLGDEINDYIQLVL